MFFIVFLAFFSFYRCDVQVDYEAEQGNVTWTIKPNEYIRINDTDDGLPKEIEYLQTIEPQTGLMVRVIFGDENGPLDENNANATRMNICDILDRAIDKPQASQARYNMPQSLGLTSMRCPIEKGIRILSPYHFPTAFTTKDLGSGDRFYEMIVETVDENLRREAIMAMRVDVKLTRKNEPTYTESSSSNSLIASMIGSLAVVALVFAM